MKTTFKQTAFGEIGSNDEFRLTPHIEAPKLKKIKPEPGFVSFNAIDTETEEKHVFSTDVKIYVEDTDEFKKYLTVNEFVQLAEGSNAITILTKRDYRDGQGKRLRSKCKSPVKNLHWKDGKLSWSDSDGDVKLSNLTSDTLMKDLTEDETYFTSAIINSQNQ